MHVEDDLAGGAVGVLDTHERRGGGLRELGGRCEVGARQQDELAGGAGLTDGVDGGLAGGGPCSHGCKIVGLVHDAEDDLRCLCVLGRELGKQAGVLSIAWTALADDATIPSSIVVAKSNNVSCVMYRHIRIDDLHVDDAHLGTGRHATLD